LYTIGLCAQKLLAILGSIVSIIGRGGGGGEHVCSFERKKEKKEKEKEIHFDDD
jgi:hypothetical protein